MPWTTQSQMTKALLSLLAIVALGIICWRGMKIFDRGLRFSELHERMSMGQVQNCVGLPQAVVTNVDGVHWDFTRWLVTGHTTVFFDANGLVCGIHSHD